MEAGGGDRLRWRRSSHCSDSSCVEVAWSGEDVLVRDAKDQDGPALRFTGAEWAAFVRGVLDGEFQG